MIVDFWRMLINDRLKNPRKRWSSASNDNSGPAQRLEGELNFGRAKRCLIVVKKAWKTLISRKAMRFRFGERKEISLEDVDSGRPQGFFFWWASGQNNLGGRWWYPRWDATEGDCWFQKDTEISLMLSFRWAKRWFPWGYRNKSLKGILFLRGHVGPRP